MSDQAEPIRKSLLPCIPPWEWQFHTVYGARTDTDGCALFPDDTGPVVVRRRVTYGDWEPVRPDHWAPEPPPEAAGARHSGQTAPDGQPETSDGENGPQTGAQGSALRDALAEALEREDALHCGYDHGFASTYGRDDETDGFVDAILAAVEEFLDIADAEAWCKTCRRVWDGPRHQCEGDAEQRLDKVRDLRNDLRDVTGARWIADALDTILDQPTESEAKQ